MDEQLWTVKDVAHYMQVGKKTVYKYTKLITNPLPHVPVGGSRRTIRFHACDVLAWAESFEQRVSPLPFGNVTLPVLIPKRAVKRQGVHTSKSVE